VDGAEAGVAGVEDVDVPDPFEASELELSVLPSLFVGGVSDEPALSVLAPPFGDA
jgi:hypothetical protein